MHGGFGHFFEKLDTNADGQVSRDELRADVQRKFAEFDLDKNGKVTAAELQTHSAGKFDKFREHIAERINKADANGDGKWTKDELSRMPERIFAKLDTNKD